MTREQVKAMLPEGTADEVVTKVLDALHAELSPHKEAAKKAQEELAAKLAEMEEISKKAATADEKTKAYDELQRKYTEELKAAQEKAASLEFGSELDSALRDKGAKNLKAARALLDVETLRASNNRKADIASAIEKLAQAEDTSFLFGAQPTGGKADIGTETKPGSAPDAHMAMIRAAAGLPPVKTD